MISSVALCNLSAYVHARARVCTYTICIYSFQGKIWHPIYSCCHEKLIRKCMMQINNGESAELCENVFSSTEIANLVELIHQLRDAGKKGELGMYVAVDLNTYIHI